VAAQAQVLAMPDSANNRLVAVNPLNGSLNGSLRNAERFPLAGSTQVHALGVGNEIRVSEQIGDRVSRWGADGSFLGQIGGAVAVGGMDNVRGMGPVGGTVYVTNAGTGVSTQLYSGGGRHLELITVVPEPATVLLWAGGLLAVVGVARRRRAR
jgi:PEP-CTERM motif